MSNSTGNNSTSPAIGLSAEQIDTVDKISTVVQILSLLGSLFIIVTYLFLKKHRGALSFVLVFILSSVDLANQITDMLEPSGEQILAMRQAGPPYSVQCYIQSVGQGVLELSSVLWTTAMCATLYAVVEWKWEVRPTCKVLSWLSLVCFGVPIALTIAAGADGALGPSTSWCYVTDAKAYWRWILLYGPLWTAVLFNGIVYGRIYWRLKRTLTTSAQSSATESQASRARIDAVMRRLVWYPAILVVVWFWPTVNRLNEAVTGRQVFALTLLQRTFSSSQGLLNALVYGLSPGVRESLHEILVPYIPACCASYLAGPGLCACCPCSCCKPIVPIPGGGAGAASGGGFTAAGLLGAATSKAVVVANPFKAATAAAAAAAAAQASPSAAGSPSSVSGGQSSSGTMGRGGSAHIALSPMSIPGTASPRSASAYSASPVSPQPSSGSGGGLPSITSGSGRGGRGGGAQPLPAASSTAGIGGTLSDAPRVGGRYARNDGDDDDDDDDDDDIQVPPPVGSFSPGSFAAAGAAPLRAPSVGFLSSRVGSFAGAGPPASSGPLASIPAPALTGYNADSSAGGPVVIRMATDFLRSAPDYEDESQAADNIGSSGSFDGSMDDATEAAGRAEADDAIAPGALAVQPHSQSARLAGSLATGFTYASP